MSEEIIIRPLGFEEWDLVAPVVTGEFKDAMPSDPRLHTFVAALDGEKLAGFFEVETLLRIFHLHVAPEYRRTALTKRLMREAANGYAKGTSAVLLTDENALAAAARREGARDLGQVRFLRKDF